MAIKKKTLVAFLMVFALALGIFAGTLLKGEEKAMANPTNENTDRKIVSASGEGVVRVTPDIALVSLGVETTNKEMSKAQTANREKMNEIMTALENLGIKEQDIQTNQYSVYPDYRWENDNNVLKGYRVVNSVSVKVRKIDDTGKVLDTAANKGANLVNGIQFTVDDSTALYKEALKLAVKDAEDKAKVMTSYFGIGKLTPVTITEKQYGYHPLSYMDSGARMAEPAGSTPISTGELEIRASVDVSFEY